jgi:AcrR family transcriptional regulator
VAPTRRARNAQARGDRTRQSILDETVRCVREEGFAAASANHIAERAGVTWGVIQYHFGDRDGLLMAVVDDGYELLRRNVEGFRLPAGTNRERVEALVAAAWAAFADPRSLAALEILIGTRANRNAVLDARLTALAHSLAHLGRELTGAASGSTHADAIGDLLWATLRGLALAQMVVDTPIDSTIDSTPELAVLVDLLTTHLDTPTSASSDLSPPVVS